MRAVLYANDRSRAEVNLQEGTGAVEVVGWKDRRWFIKTHRMEGDQPIFEETSYEMLDRSVEWK